MGELKRGRVFKSEQAVIVPCLLGRCGEARFSNGLRRNGLVPGKTIGRFNIGGGF